MRRWGIKRVRLEVSLTFQTFCVKALRVDLTWRDANARDSIFLSNHDFVLSVWDLGGNPLQGSRKFIAPSTSTTPSSSQDAFNPSFPPSLPPHLNIASLESFLKSDRVRNHYLQSDLAVTQRTMISHELKGVQQRQRALVSLELSSARSLVSLGRSGASKVTSAESCYPRRESTDSIVTSTLYLAESPSLSRCSS
ncbi:hypothetical protein BC830DRAFT_797153 [Chytriomyces sp. MP71]|nr:hypothetical protein BC830DRAFT_797153 [Chytriomyces sp. MP71]